MADKIAEKEKTVQRVVHEIYDRVQAPCVEVDRPFNTRAITITTYLYPLSAKA